MRGWYLYDLTWYRPDWVLSVDRVSSSPYRWEVDIYMTIFFVLWPICSLPCLSRDKSLSSRKKGKMKNEKKDVFPFFNRFPIKDLTVAFRCQNLKYLEDDVFEHYYKSAHLTQQIHVYISTERITLKTLYIVALLCIWEFMTDLVRSVIYIHL